MRNLTIASRLIRGKKAEPGTEDSPRTKIISLRISDDEMASLETISRITSKNISEIMREALNGWKAELSAPGADAVTPENESCKQVLSNDSAA